MSAVPLVQDDVTHRKHQKLETLQANIEATYMALSEAVKHKGYETIAEFSPKFSKEVILFLNSLRHTKEKLNGQSSGLEDSIAFLDTLGGYIETLKDLSHTYKENDNFMHTSELRQIIQNERAQLAELQQALLSTRELLN